MNNNVQSVRERYLQVLEKIASAARSVGRDPALVKLVVVIKNQPAEIVRTVIEAGAVILGENYPEEGVMKLQSLREFSAVEWHMIGHVQSRKAQLVVENFNYLHSLDSLKLAVRLDQLCGEVERKLPTLLEFNVSGEETKAGWPAWDETNWPSLLDEIAPVIALPNLQICGLMTMPPLVEVAELSRAHFQQLKRLQQYLSSQFPKIDFSELSMGTSSDYEVAIQAGATYVRVGSAIVGPRQYKKEK